MPQGHEGGDKIVAKVDRQIRLPRPSLRCSPRWPLLVRLAGYAILEQHSDGRSLLGRTKEVTHFVCWYYPRSYQHAARCSITVRISFR